MKVLSVKDPAFKKYGKVVDNVDFTELVEALKKTPLPEAYLFLIYPLLKFLRLFDNHIQYNLLLYF